jgi:hypothetical protein
MALTLSACQPALLPPPLADMDHRRIMAFDMLGSLPAGFNPAEVTTSSTTDCVDLHRSRLSLARNAGWLTWDERWLLRLGIGQRFDDWVRYEEQSAASGPNTERASTSELKTAATAVLLGIDSAASRARDAVWPESCRSTYSHQRPVYVGHLAFVETADWGDGIGGTKLIALEYRDGSWHVVAEHTLTLS